MENGAGWPVFTSAATGEALSLFQLKQYAMSTKKQLSICLFLLFFQTLFAQTGVPYGKNPQAGKYLVANGIRLYYEIYGAGQPLLLLHGNGGSIASRRNEIPWFSNQYMVIAVDSRCHGKSACMTSDLLRCKSSG